MRTRLRQTLLSRVPEDWVHFGRTCISAEPPTNPGEPIKLQFSDGSQSECDVLVVADGTNSKLRKYLMPEEKPGYTGVTMLFVSLLTFQYTTLRRRVSACSLIAMMATL